MENVTIFLETQHQLIFPIYYLWYPWNVPKNLKSKKKIKIEDTNFNLYYKGKDIVVRNLSTFLPMYTINI